MAKKEKERVVQTKLGRKSITQDKILLFPRGLIGFEREHEFTLLQIRDESPFLILQSMTDPRLGLMVADPYAFIPDYEVKIGDPERKILRIENVRQVAVLVTVSIPPGEPDHTTLNLAGPIVINTVARLGLQIPQVDSRFAGQFLLKDLGRE